MPIANSKITREIERIKQEFRTRGFNNVEAYRYNMASIRLRVISKRFAGMSRMRRCDIANKIIDILPEEIQHDIIFVALLTPAEAKYSPISYEFEEPEDL